MLLAGVPMSQMQWILIGLAVVLLGGLTLAFVLG
jgi:hypothetical protein